MRYKETYQIQTPRAKVWDFIISPNKIGKCLPDLKSLEMDGEDQFIAVVRVGIGSIRGDFKFRLRIMDKQPPSQTRLKGSGSGAGSSVDLDTAIELTETPEDTKLFYQADVKVGGLLTGLGQRMMNTTTEKNRQRGLRMYQKGT